MLRLYKQGLKSGLLHADTAQNHVVGMLERLQHRLGVYDGELVKYRTAYAEIEKTVRERKRGEKLNVKNDEQKEEDPFAKLQFPRKPKGLYIHGNVGTGKTVLMDMFYETLDIQRKRRVHLHDFMIQVHQDIHHWKKTHKIEEDEEEEQKNETLDVGHFHRKQLLRSESDGITQVAKTLSRKYTLLAFDEFVVTDVVDALILKHLFGVMFKEGTVVVATSNTPPDDLYKDGLNYYYFAPFINILKSHCKVVDMNSDIDYRYKNKEGVVVGDDDVRYLHPITQETKERFDRIYANFCSNEPDEVKTVDVAFGRRLKVSRASGRVCRFDFEELCGDREPVMGATDFQAICNHFDTIMIENVPTLGLENHNQSRRFITLVDQLYDRGVNLFILAERSPTQLFDTASILDVGEDGSGANTSQIFSLKEIVTASRRMASRLVEMTM